VNGVEPGGTTALGPALIASLGLASTGNAGSKIIVCTDGLANKGLGDETKPNDPETIHFYQRVGDTAVSYGITISVVTIKGTVCRIDALGPLTDRTSGTILRVDPANLDFSQLAKEEVLATQVQLKVLLHESLAFRNENKENLTNNGSILLENVGNVTQKSEVSLNIELKIPKNLQLNKFLWKISNIFRLKLSWNISIRMETNISELSQEDNSLQTTRKK